nr:TPA: gp72-like protein [Oryctes rhinoceros nudivirus]
MNVSITNIQEFINSIHDFIIETFEIIPRDFETKLLVGNRSLVWHSDVGKIEEFICPKFKHYLHVHEKHNADENLTICCNEVDIIALKYLNDSIFGTFKNKIISSLHSWLPAATYQHVRVVVRSNTTYINSYFEPSYLFNLLHYIDHSRDIIYTYYHSNIVLYESYNLEGINNKRIMVRARSRSPGRARSPGRTRSGRARSPAKASKRQRSRSRSRSRSASRTARGSSGRARRASSPRRQSSTTSRSRR